MPRIIKLDKNVIERIAAGEVVERPASVVKELIENSIDAGASRILIEVQGAGLKKIRVSDDGIGMDKEDAVLAVQRYTTSKIRSPEDLERIVTLGFRGEALASIGAVSFLKIITRTHDSEIGTEVSVEGGTIKRVEPVGCSPGTTVIVENLFFNAPARKKFLKSADVELSEIVNTVTRYVLAYPHISFRLISDGKVLISSPAARDLLEKILHIYGRRVSEAMIKVEYEADGVKITGYTSKPDVTRGTRSHMNIYVNGRPVIDETLYKAILDAYGPTLPKRRYPICVLNLEIDPSRVDVNVHPTKREVRFDNPDLVYNALRDAIRNSLFSQKAVPAPEEKTFIMPPEMRESERRLPEVKQIPLTSIRVEGLQTKLEEFEEREKEVVSRGVTWKIAGQVADSFIIAYDDENMYVIDQHAAHERVIFERLRRRRMEKGIKKQSLLAPIVVELPPAEAEFLRRNIEYFKSFGIDVAEFGGNSFIIRALPATITSVDEKSVREFLMELLTSNGRVRRKVPSSDEVLATIACRSAIKAGEKLDPETMRKILQDLLREVKNPFICPHGRPTIAVFPISRLKKLFKR